MRALFLLLALLLAAGCGDDGGGAGTTTAPTPDVSLDIRFDDGRGTVRTASLRCGGGDPAATGYLSGGEPAELCRSALAVEELLTEQPPEDRVCTQIYGGPQTARITGTLAGEEVDRRFSRVNGCRIAEWDRLQEAGLLPAAEGPPRP